MPDALDPHQPLGLNTYSLRAFRWTDRTLLEFASGLKLDAVFLQDSLDPEINQLEHWRNVGAHAKELGLHIETGIGAILPQAPSYLEMSRKQLRVGIDRAKACGSPIVRCLHAGDRAHLPAGTMEEHQALMIQLLRSMRSEVVDAGLKVAIENHKDLQAWEMKQVIEGAGSDFVGSYLDTGNPVYVMEDPLTTLDVLGPHALTVHLRDSVIYEDPRGARVQWVPLGEGTIDFPAFIKRLHQINPSVYVYAKPITGRPADLIPYYDRDFWKPYPNARAEDFTRFLDLARHGRPYQHDMVVEDVPGRAMPEPFAAAMQFQQRDHLERSVLYARNVLNLGRKWRNAA